jgi:hypothetical protein
MIRRKHPKNYLTLVKNKRESTKLFEQQIVDQVNKAGGLLTIRHLFYLMVSAGFVEKSELGYHKVDRFTVQMRINGILPYNTFIDNSRMTLQYNTYESFDQGLQDFVNSYQRWIWSHQNDYVEVWCEKDALSNILFQTTGPYHVPLRICHGSNSITKGYEASEDIKEMSKRNKSIFIYYLGDYDPKGKESSNDVENKLRYLFKCNISFQQLAINEAQIKQYNLPTRPTKSTNKSSVFTDSRSVELDAIDPAVLKDLVEQAIKKHIDWTKFNEIKKEEEKEIVILKTMFNPL